MGALLGDEVVEAGPGDLVFKPRDQWHTFWNAGDEPAGSSRSSPRPASSTSSRSSSSMGGALKADPEELAALSARYGLEMQPETVPELLERFDLRIGEPTSGARISPRPQIAASRAGGVAAGAATLPG